MQVEIFCLCKAVSINRLNQPTIIDIFDNKIAAGEPALLEPFFAVASIRFYKTELGTHRFRFVVRDHTGTELMSQTEIVSFPSMAQESTTYFIQALFPQRLSPFGVYWFSIEAGEKPLAKIPLYVIQEKTS